MAVWHEEMGMSPAQIAATYPTITLAQVHAALAYYYGQRDDIQAAIAEEDRFVEELKAKSGPSLLQERLRQRKNASRHGIDVTTTVDAGLLHAHDEQQFAFGIFNGRVIFTQDEDFLRIHATGTPHAGITYCHQKTRTIGQIIDGLVLIWELLDRPEIETRVEFI